MFSQPKSTPSCLSLWRISQLAAEGKGAFTAQELEHVPACELCRCRFTDEHEAVLQNRKQSLPPQLQALLQPRTVAPPAAQVSLFARLQPWLLWPSLASAALVCIVVARAPDEAADRSHRLKGKAAINISILREGEIVANDVPLEQAPPLRSGDRLRLRAMATANWYCLWAASSGKGAWNVLANGAMDKTGWLDVGLLFDEHERTQLNLWLCPTDKSPVTQERADVAAPKGCQSVEFSL